MSKPDQVFIWHSGSEVDVVYEDFRLAFVGSRPISNHLYLVDGLDDFGVTQDEIIPKRLARSSAVIMLLSGSEKADGEIAWLLQGIANASHPIAFAMSS